MDKSSGTCMCSLDCQQDLALLSLPTVAWTLTLHVHDLLNDVYAVLATIVCFGRGSVKEAAVMQTEHAAIRLKDMKLRI